MFIEPVVEQMEPAPVKKRVAEANSLARLWLQLSQDAEKRETAEAAMTCILDDPAEEVRVALGEAIAQRADAPRHLILSLAADSTSVSLPVLMQSPVLIDAELADHVINGKFAQQVAVACRKQVSPRLAEAIAGNGCEEACLALIMNPCATMNREIFFAIAERYGDSEEVRKCLLARHDIGMRTRILLIDKYALTLLDEDIGKDDPKGEARIRDACDKAVIAYAAQFGDAEISEIVKALIDEQRLTTAFLLRAICMGNIGLFVHALAHLADQPAARIERILKDERLNAFSAAYAKAGLPIQAREVFRLTIAAWRRHLTSAEHADQSKLPWLVTREVLAAFSGRGEEVDGLVVLLRRICTEAARDSARATIDRLRIEAQSMPALPSYRAQADANPLNQEELTRFAEHFADELAEEALADEAALRSARANLAAANYDGNYRDTTARIDDGGAIATTRDAIKADRIFPRRPARAA